MHTSTPLSMTKFVAPFDPPEAGRQAQGDNSRGCQAGTPYSTQNYEIATPSQARVRNDG